MKLWLTIIASLFCIQGLAKEGEFKSFIKLWFFAIAIFIPYCFFIAAKIPKGFPRLLSLFPVITLLLILPFKLLNTIHLGAPMVFYLSWITNFKLLLFAFDKGPLSPPPSEVHLFVLTACSPFKVKQTISAKIQNENPKFPSLVLEAANKVTLLVLLFYSYNFKQYFHENFLLTLYFFHTYLNIQLMLAAAAIPAQLILHGVELEPQFNAPLLTTSLQDFWGHRWNLMVSDTLRPTIYNPLRNLSERIIGPRWASLPAVFATFFTSGLMHELIYYNVTREKPTWEVTWFFVLQGIFVDIEIFLKKKLVVTGKCRPLHRAISGPLALANIALTSGWLSYTQLLRNGVDERLVKECDLFLEFLKGTN